MNKVTVTLELPKETQELFNGLFKIVKSIKIAMDDGWDITTDLPTVITQSLIELAPMIQGCEQLPGEFKADPSAFIKAAVLSAGDIASLFIEAENQSI